jgi:hypothetical protein
MAEWISSLPASRAKTSPLLGAESALMGSAADSSSKSPGSPTIAVRNSFFWRTSQASLVPPLPLWTRPAPPTMPPSPLETAFRTWALKMVAYSSARPPASWENWPTSGGMRNGSLFPRPMWVPAMAARAGSASPGETWPTPVANDDNKTPEAHMAMKHRMKGGPRNSITSLQVKVQTNWLTPHGMSGMESATGKAGAGGEFAKQATHWMTPSVVTATGQEYTRDGGIKGQERLALTGQAKQVVNWATPRATDGEKGGPNCRGGRGDPILAGQVCQWPTPDVCSAARDMTKVDPARQRKADTKVTIGLPTAALSWPTPAARDFKGHGAQGGASENGREITDGSIGERSGLFAPGPSDNRWPGLIATFPWLAPALESTFRGVVNGLAFDMGDSRAARLKCVGNGVVPLCAATAFVLLARRAGILKGFLP